MSSVVFLRAVNVGAANRCSTAAVAKQLAQFKVVNIGAAGTFVVQENVAPSSLRAAFASVLPFTCEIMICRGEEILSLAAKQPFVGQPAGPEITWFVDILHKPLQSPPVLPITLPQGRDWLLKVIAVERRFVLGLYRRQMKAISYLGKLEKLLGVPATNRNWNTIEKAAKILGG